MEEHEEYHQDQHEPGVYEIRVSGHLDDRRAAWFEGLTLTRDANDDTILAGSVIDKTARHVFLRKGRALGKPRPP